MKNKDDGWGKLDTLCKHLVSLKSYSVLGVIEDDTLVPFGVSTDDDFRWPVSDISELAPLMSHFDVILTRSTGLSLEVVCIKNLLPENASPISVSLDLIQQIGRECKRRIHKNEMFVNFQLWELTTFGCSDIEHLQDLCFRTGLQNRIGVSSWSLNILTLEVWTNARFRGLFSGRKSTRKAMSLAVAGEIPIPRKEVKIGTSYELPIMTFAMIGVMGIVFVLQLILGDFTGWLTPTTKSLIKLGGAYEPAILAGKQWYRLFSSGFMHADPIHLIFNALALFLGGLYLEMLIGRAWLLTVFFISLLSGSLASLVINEPEIVSVGASGAIMGMLGTALMVTFKMPYGHEQTSAQVNLLYWLVPALLPIFSDGSGEKIDYAGHLGGAIAGILLGIFILKTWKPNEPLPSFYKPALAVGGSGAVLIYLSLVKAYINRF